MLSSDHYAVLGVAPDADEGTIEAAYRSLCRRYHPDLNPGDPRAHAAFERVRLAYRVLTDAGERERYDRDGRPTADQIEMVGDAGASAIQGDPDGSFAELFRRLCEHSRRTRPLRGRDVHATVKCRLVDAERGRRTTVAVRRLQPCEDCSGRRLVATEQATACSTCGGSGKEIFGRGVLSVAVCCADCAGAGVRSGSGCPVCHASGLTGTVETVAVQIPAGVLDGQELRVAGGGHSGKRGGPSGDLIVAVNVQGHPHFDRHGPHLTTAVPVSISEAILGARVQISTLDGTAWVRIPPGVRNGQELRVRGEGLEMANGRRGDLLATVEIWIPDVVDEDAKRLLREFGERTAKPARTPSERATVQR
jgi:molecular chaperone DnaJ